MVQKKGVCLVFAVIAVLSILLIGCTIVKEGVSAPAGGGQVSPSGETLPEEQKTAPSTPLGSCDDSIDGGNSPYVKGNTKVTYNKKVTSFTDTCSNEEYLTEYYCDGSEYKFYSKLCAYGCSDGACLQAVPQETPPPEPEPEPPAEEPAPKTIPECFDGYRDLEETDVDCGGPNCKPCGYGKHCQIKRDCAAPLTCNLRNFLCLEVVH